MKFITYIYIMYFNLLQDEQFKTLFSMGYTQWVNNPSNFPSPLEGITNNMTR